MSTLLAIDPGKDAGYSFWYTDTLPVLMSCGLGTRDIGRLIDYLVIEMPQIYESREVDPQDLIKLAMNAGRHVERIVVNNPSILVYGVRPATWKKQIPKKIHHAHIQAAIGVSNLRVAVTAEKLITPSKRHNMWDAVGLGLWACKRVGMLRTCTDYMFPSEL